jgi:hypothetical protein
MRNFRIRSPDLLNLPASRMLEKSASGVLVSLVPTR